MNITTLSLLLQTADTFEVPPVPTVNSYCDGTVAVAPAGTVA
jgi:hypothetical protein